MLRSWGACSVILFSIIGILALGAGPGYAQSEPMDPIDYIEESAVAGIIGPDVIVGDLYQIARYGSEGGISAYAVGTVSCNIGDFWLSWCEEDRCGDRTQHPVIGQSMYRLKSDRFEHIGQSWLKHGFYALSDSLCYADCQPTNGDHLGVHCSDPYQASLNGTQSNLGPKYQVNAHTGAFPYPPASPSYSGVIARRLQVRNSDLDPSLNPGALYFVEGHYVTQDDSEAGNQNNNASYRRVTVTLGTGGACPTGQYCLALVGTTQREQSAIRAWKDTDPSVVEREVQVPDDGLFILSAKATDLGTGYWHYEYALQNLNSDRSGGSFTVPLPEGVIIPPESIGFHDVDYHSGEPWNGTDWPATVEIGKITWATTPYNENAAANALRWGTLYNFRFDANIGPSVSTVTVGLFKPGTPPEVSFQSVGPMGGLVDCNGNEIQDACDVDCQGLGCIPPCGPSCTGGPNEGLSCASHSDCPDALCAGLDCNENIVPDECEADCNHNNIPDSCDIRDCPPEDLRCADCQPNGVPDECEIPPLCPSCADCDENGIPDVCEPVSDCDGDGVEDCDDECPCTTPINACVPAPTVTCCFCASGGLCLINYPRGSCLALNGTPICSVPADCSGTPCPDSACRSGCLVGDFDRDGDLDLFDVGALQGCYSAPVGNPAYVTPSEECLFAFDFDEDGDVDLTDLDEFLSNITGP